MRNTLQGTSDHYQREIVRLERNLREIRLVLARHKKAVRNGRIVIEIPANLVKKYEF